MNGAWQHTWGRRGSSGNVKTIVLIRITLTNLIKDGVLICMIDSNVNHIAKNRTTGGAHPRSTEREWRIDRLRIIVVLAIVGSRCRTPSSAISENLPLVNTPCPTRCSSSCKGLQMSSFTHSLIGSDNTWHHTVIQVNKCNTIHHLTPHGIRHKQTVFSSRLVIQLGSGWNRCTIHIFPVTAIGLCTVIHQHTHTTIATTIACNMMRILHRHSRSTHRQLHSQIMHTSIFIVQCISIGARLRKLVSMPNVRQRRSTHRSVNSLASVIMDNHRLLYRWITIMNGEQMVTELGFGWRT